MGILSFVFLLGRLLGLLFLVGKRLGVLVVVSRVKSRGRLLIAVVEGFGDGHMGTENVLKEIIVIRFNYH